MRFRLKGILFILILLITRQSFGQDDATVYGRISDASGRPMPMVNVSLQGRTSGAVTSQNGSYELLVPANTDITVIISFIGYKTLREKLLVKAGQKMELNRRLVNVVTELNPIEISDERSNRSSNLIKINPKTATFIPSAAGGGIESLIKTMPGVTSNNELSSQYSVRGGNFDENLVYVNDVEIYRPFLVRSGQQEGLSFLNSDLVSSILFSAGGFDAKYGDKLSSVLDIQYKRPTAFASSVTLSLLGASAHVEGSLGENRFTYLLGARQKSNQYILNSLQTKGEYRPSFTDIQTCLVYSFNKKTELSFLGNFSRNLFRVVPQDRETAFGTLTEAYQFKVYFEGQEKDKFINYLGALSLSHHPRVNLGLKLIASAFQTIETESFDILGQYYLSRLETDWGKDDFGTAVEAIGVGSYLNHARNTLNAVVVNIEQKGSWEYNTHFLQWGVKYQNESIHDRLSEWTLIDSAGYSLPRPMDSVGYSDPAVQPAMSFDIYDFARAKNRLSSNRYSGFVQNAWILNTDSTKMTLTAGIRGQYWDVNRQFLISPRLSLSYKPNWKKDVLLRIAGGVYHQPPFYRELRDSKGKLNLDLKGQSSYQVVAGSDWNFAAWRRPFKFVTEVYYKYLDNLIPYEVDNVRIRYDAENKAVGYAYGIDLRINGEFVKGAESWASVSVMKTMEDIRDDFYYTAEDSLLVKPGFLHRPTDQRVNFNLFFQDFLPNNPTFKMHLNLVFGSSLYFGSPKSPKYKHTYKMPPYKRVDIGFSKLIKGENTQLRAGSFLNKFKTLWVSLEILNLLQISNTISYLWVADITNSQYAIPNYLTPRQLNLKIYAQF